jgi:hypothetical protein
MSRSTALLCKGGRKVFVVDNLFAREEPAAAQEKRRWRDGWPAICTWEMIELIRNNVGMQMTVQGTKTFYPLISAGVNWYVEAEAGL